MTHKVEYIAKLICQGQLKRKVNCKHLFQAVFYIFKWVRKYGQYGTMKYVKESEEEM